MFVVIRPLVAVILLWLTALPAQAANRLVIDFMFSSGQQRTAWFNLVSAFAKANPDVEVVNEQGEQEEYKREFLQSLQTRKIDIAFWFAGERLRQSVKAGLLQPFDDAYTASVLKPNFVKSTLEAASVDGQVYGFPIQYYQWGFFYRKSIFAKLHLDTPTTWDAFLAHCEALKKAGISPLAVGAEEAWPAAAWFDYLDLRINGIDFHRKLLHGAGSFDDPRVRKVFAEWKGLLDKNYFLPETMDRRWDSVMPFLYHDRVGMVLMGGFIAAKIPASLAPDIGFFPFPRYANGVGAFEEAPLDILVMPKNGENPEAARRFLRYLATSDGLNQFNQVLHTVSPRSKGAESADPVARSAKSLLNAAAGITLYFDRDASDSLVAPSFQAFKQFLQQPHDVDAAIATIVGRR